MARPRVDNLTRNRCDIDDISAQLAALSAMTVRELRDKYREVYGEPSRSRNKDYLRKKVAWRIQELAERGLSERATARIDELAAGLPLSWRQRLQPLQRHIQEEAQRAEQASDTKSKPKRRSRDRRLPEPGAVLKRLYQGKEYTVTVMEDGFEYGGQNYKSLSQIAREITDTQWNGFTFFGLQSRSRKRAGKPKHEPCAMPADEQP